MKLNILYKRVAYKLIIFFMLKKLENNLIKFKYKKVIKFSALNPLNLYFNADLLNNRFFLYNIMIVPIF